ncbi:MAG TPA: endolytic transglycosylase MltG, partial [Solirubrobacteraceae bacterium]|nr:endolytic transglycosylase MltG [Solirubrobacteraceae bacterium]
DHHRPPDPYPDYGELHPPAYTGDGDRPSVHDGRDPGYAPEPSPSYFPEPGYDEPSPPAAPGLFDTGAHRREAGSGAIEPEVGSARAGRARAGSSGAARPAAGVPAVLARAGAVLAGAGAALAGAAAAGRARVPKKLASPRAGRTAAERPARSGAGSLRAATRDRLPRRAPVRTAVRPARPGRTASVSKLKRNQSDAPGAPPSRRGRIAAVVALVGVVFALWFIFSLFQPLKGSGQGTVTVDIPRGASSSTIATLLADRGVISSPFFFKLRATLAGKRSQLESGHFSLRKDMSYGAVLDALTGTQGTPTQITVTIPEGLSRAEIAAVAKRDGVTGDYFRASVHSHLLKPQSYGAPSGAAHSLEGFLFPATYDLLPGDPASKLVNKQLAAFKANIAKVDLSRAHKARLSTFDVLTIASMVEREAQLASERPLIAAVIYNRLRSGMPLGIDATLRYALKDYTRPLTASELRLPTPYNTRLHKGLPPTPIGNPGLASIEAAAHPAAVTYQYYVVRPGTCGQHAFSSTFAQFQQDVARYNSARAAKGGNSPTTCGHP